MHVFQVGAGSGGIIVLDLLCREASITRITLVEPDHLAAHNVHRHLFPESAVGRLKGDLAAEWVRERRPDLTFDAIAADVADPARQDEFNSIASACSIGVGAVDNERAKFAFDALMRRAGKPWTLGEVLSGGIGGWVHRFVPHGACYGCVATHLQRSVIEAPPAPAPDYSARGGVPETTIPANRASIQVIASLHAMMTIDMLAAGAFHNDDNPTSLLLTLERVAGVFEEAFRSYRFRIARNPECLACGRSSVPGGDLDVALDQALGRLAPQ
jgi:molybdopterin/thiamine biosynthesis adenylyltransferase